MLMKDKTPKNIIKPVRRLLLAKDGARRPKSALTPPNGVWTPPSNPRPLPLPYPILALAL